MKLRFEDFSSFPMFWCCFLQSFQSHHRCPQIPDFDLRQRSASHQWNSFAFLVRWSSNDYANHPKQHLSKNPRFFLSRNFQKVLTESKQHSADTQRKFIYTINTSRIKLSDFAIRIRMKLRFQDSSPFWKFCSCFLQSFQSHNRCPRIPDFDLRQRSALSPQ